jgi:hypothetical protein
MSLFSFITNFLEPFALLIYFVALWVYYQKNKTPATKLLFIYYLLVTILQLFSSTIVKIISISNIWMYDIVAVLTIVCISIYFHQLLQTSKKKKAVVTMLCVSLIYTIIRHATIEGMRLFDSIGYSIISASIALYVFMYFHQVLQNVTHFNILKDFNFWLASGYLIYFVGSFIIFVSYYYFTKKILKTYTKAERDVLTALWGLHNVLLFISALSLLIGSLWVTYRKKLESS